MVTEILAGVQVLRSLLQAGMSARDVWKEESFGKEEVAALGALHGTVDGLWKLKPNQEEELGSQHLAFVARCFGQAIRRYQEYLHQIVSPQQRALFSSEAGVGQQHQLAPEKMEQRLKSVAQIRISPGSMPVAKPEFDLVESLTGNPLNTPYYRFLWDAFFKPMDGEPSLLPLETGGRVEFERYFVLAWGEAMASTIGERLRQYLEGLQRDYKPRLIQEILISDMAGWGSRHTFGNLTRGETREGDPLPFMPLEEMYVQPYAQEVGQQNKSVGLVIEKLQQLLQKHRIVIVQADFGMGKSLTSRMLAYQRALIIREADEPTPDLELPVHVRCVDDLRSHDLSVQGAVQRARQRQASILGYSLEADDKALAFPARDQRTLFLLDGLDEVHLGETGLKTFFENIKDKAKAVERHRFVIFSRPGVIPSGRHVQAIEGIPILELCPWRREQVDEWLERWQRVNQGRGPTRSEITQQGLSELAATPILLLMIAHIWDPAMRGKAVGRSELYERFFQSIARGKHEAAQEKHPEAAQEKHPAILEASGRLREHLIAKQVLDRHATETDAMLWLMSRVAWEAVRLETGGSEPEPLTHRHIVNLLYDELKFRDDHTVIIDLVLTGLLLALQANLHAGSASQILFGHKSFREFLVARYWADRLRALVKGTSRQDIIEKELLGGKLLGREDKSFGFLKEMLNADPECKGPPGQNFGLSSHERSKLFQWAEERFQDERLMGREARPDRLRDDLSVLLREAALAIGSHLIKSKGVAQANSRTLRSMFAQSFLIGNVPLIKAPRAQLPQADLYFLNLQVADFHEAYLTGADLHEADLREADFTKADLLEANLNGANLSGANLTEADLRKANLHKADLRGANLGIANLRQALLSSATLFRARLFRADFREADLTGAILYKADLRDANLSASKLDGADLREADLTGANLYSADIRTADLTGAILHRADLRDAKLGEADLRKAKLGEADLRGADLCGANLEEADLMGADLMDARYDDQTNWNGFNAPAAGAKLIPPGTTS